MTLYTSTEVCKCDEVVFAVMEFAKAEGLPLQIVDVPKDAFATTVVKPGYTFGVPQVLYDDEVYAGFDLLDRLRPAVATKKGSAHV